MTRNDIANVVHEKLSKAQNLSAIDISMLSDHRHQPTHILDCMRNQKNLPVEMVGYSIDKSPLYGYSKDTIAALKNSPHEVMEKKRLKNKEKRNKRLLKSIDSACRELGTETVMKEVLSMTNDERAHPADLTRAQMVFLKHIVQSV